MMPDFGVGIRQYFFEQINPLTFEGIASAIREQQTRYMPFIVINEIVFQTNDQDPTLSFNQVSIQISYSLPGVDSEDTLQITAEQTYL